MRRWISAVWSFVKKLYAFYLPIRFSFIALAVLIFAFWFSDQGEDILRALADDPASTWSGRTAMLLVASNLLAYGIWYWSRQLLRFRPYVTRDECRDPIREPLPAEMKRATDWSPRLLGLAVFIIEIVGFALVARYRSPYTHVWWIIAALAIFAIIYLVIVHKRTDFLHLDPTKRYATVSTWGDFDRGTRAALLASIVFEALLFGWAWINPVSWWILGVAATLVFTIGIWVPLGSAAVAVGEYWRFPILGALIVWAFLISPWTDNHPIRTLGSLPAKRDTLDDAFNSWYGRVQKLPRYAGGTTDVPLIIVATEGGGIRAAYWTATALASLHDQVPGFADHCFAISSVSGGSLGALVYDALLASRVEQAHGNGAGGTATFSQLAGPAATQPIGPDVKKMLNFDALSGTLASMAQPDLLQKFLPTCFGDAVCFPDRAKALEEGWEFGWRDKFRDDNFGRGFAAMMQRHRELPSLFLNGTMVETGERIITSNVDIRSSLVFRNAYDGLREIDSDIRLSTAADMSARFTYVSPAGKIPYTRGDAGRKYLGHVIDGGYFENSGGVTASEILQFVLAKQKSGVRVRPILITIDFWQGGSDSDVPFCPSPGICGPPAPKKSNRFANEVLSPLWGLLNTRGARGVQAVGDLSQTARMLGFPLIELRLFPRNVPLPLGWVLSGPAMDTIDVAMTSERGNVAGVNVVRHELGLIGPAPLPDCDHADCNRALVEQKGETQ